MHYLVSVKEGVACVPINLNEGGVVCALFSFSEGDVVCASTNSKLRGCGLCTI